MPITLAEAPDHVSLRLKLTAYTGDPAVKVTPIGGGYDDTETIAALTALDNVTNAKFEGNVAGRLISGQKGSAANALQNLISAFMVLNFEALDAISGLTVQRSFSVPSYKDILRSAGVDGQPDVGTPGTGSVDAYLGTLVAWLEDNMAYQQADQDWVTGGFTYVGGGFGTGADVTDGI
jgi:hypothetical protein